MDYFTKFKKDNKFERMNLKNWKNENLQTFI